MPPTFPSSGRDTLLLSMVFRKRFTIIQECESGEGLKVNPAAESTTEKLSHIGKIGRRPGCPHTNGDDE